MGNPKCAVEKFYCASASTEKFYRASASTEKEFNSSMQRGINSKQAPIENKMTTYIAKSTDKFETVRIGGVTLTSSETWILKALCLLVFVAMLAFFAFSITKNMTTNATSDVEKLTEPAGKPIDVYPGPVMVARSRVALFRSYRRQIDESCTSTQTNCYYSEGQNSNETRGVYVSKDSNEPLGYVYKERGPGDNQEVALWLCRNPKDNATILAPYPHGGMDAAHSDMNKSKGLFDENAIIGYLPSSADKDLLADEDARSLYLSWRKVGVNGVDVFKYCASQYQSCEKGSVLAPEGILEIGMMFSGP